MSQLAVGHSIRNGRAMPRSPVNGSLRSGKPTGHAARLVFGSGDGNTSEPDASQAPASGANRLMISTGLLVAGGALGLVAMLGALVLVPVALVLAALGGALFLGKPQPANPAADKRPLTSPSSKPTVLETEPTLDKAPFGSIVWQIGTPKGPVVMLSALGDDPSPISKQPSRFWANEADTKLASAGLPDRPDPDSSSLSPGSDEMVLSAISGGFSSTMEAPRSAAQWRDWPINSHTRTIGFAKGRFTQSFSSLADINSELSAPANNRNFTGLTLNQVLFQDIEFPLNTDFRHLKVQGAVTFSNCKLPGASFHGITGPGRITFHNTDVTGTDYEAQDARFILQNTGAP